MVRLLWEAISSSERETTFVLIGTSGFQLGQNGWIGHRAGPLRSPEIQVPAIVCQRTAGRTRMGLRISGVHSLEQVFDTVRAPYEAVNQGVREASSQDNSESYRAITPEFWAQCDSSDQPPVKLNRRERPERSRRRNGFMSKKPKVYDFSPSRMTKAMSTMWPHAAAR